jgi:hypothetical protein
VIARREQSSLRFPRRYVRRRRQWEVDTAGLHGAAGCAARMVALAESYRRMSERPMGRASAVRHCIVRMNRLQMRSCALWARIFARQVEQGDARLGEVEARLNALRGELHRMSEALPCLT